MRIQNVRTSMFMVATLICWYVTCLFYIYINKDILQYFLYAEPDACHQRTARHYTSQIYWWRLVLLTVTQSLIATLTGNVRNAFVVLDPLIITQLFSGAQHAIYQCKLSLYISFMNLEYFSLFIYTDFVNRCLYEVLKNKQFNYIPITVFDMLY